MLIDVTDVIVNLPDVTTEVVIPIETTEFTFSTYDVSGSDKKTCGTYSLSDAAGETNDHCVPNFTTSIILPIGATESIVFLHDAGLTTSFLCSQVSPLLQVSLQADIILNF